MGRETQEGAAKESEYSAVTMEWEVDILSIGESDLRENVSGMTFFLPGTWVTLKWNFIDFNRKLSNLGL